MRSHLRPSIIRTLIRASVMLALISLWVNSSVAIYAQEETTLQRETTTAPQRGFEPGGSYSLSNIESVNTTNGNLMLNIPLGGLPAGRGGLSAGINLLYNSKMFDLLSRTVRVSGEPREVFNLQDSE